MSIYDVNRFWVAIYKFAYLNNNGLSGIFFNVQMHITENLSGNYFKFQNFCGLRLYRKTIFDASVSFLHFVLL